MNCIVKLIVIIFALIGCSRWHHGSNKANIHMHKKGHKQLIAAFDDTARDKWQKPYKVIELMGSLKGKKVIDIGAGSGYFTKFFLAQGAQVVGGDVDETFLKHLKERFPQKEFPDFSVLRMEYDDPKMSANTFDFAFTSNTYHHIDRRVEYLKKVLKGLKVGGKFVVLDFKATPSAAHHFGPPLDMRIPAHIVVGEFISAGLDHIQVYRGEFEHHYLVIGTRTI